MQENYWIKRLADGVEEIGTDSLVKQGKASWTRGRQDILSVELCLYNKIIEVFCKDAIEWKQFDNYVCSVSRDSSMLMSREVICVPYIARSVRIVERGKITEIHVNPRIGGVNVPPGTASISAYINRDGTWNCRCIGHGVKC